MPLPTLDALPNGRARDREGPRRSPGNLHADKVYDHRRCRRNCRARATISRIARRTIESSVRRRLPAPTQPAYP
jgi:hypothetical protein